MSGQAFVNGPGCSCPPGLGHPHTWPDDDLAYVIRDEVGWHAWKAMVAESTGPKIARRTALALRARRARWPEAPPPPTQLGMFG